MKILKKHDLNVQILEILIEKKCPYFRVFSRGVLFSFQIIIISVVRHNKFSHQVQDRVAPLGGPSSRSVSLGSKDNYKQN